MNRFRLYTYTFVFFGILDLTFTGLLLTDPTFQETNPIADWVYQNSGFFGMAIYKFFMMLFAYLVVLVIRKESDKIATRLLAFASIVVGLVISYSFVLLSIVTHELFLISIGHWNGR